MQPKTPPVSQHSYNAATATLRTVSGELHCFAYLNTYWRSCFTEFMLFHSKKRETERDTFVNGDFFFVGQRSEKGKVRRLRLWRVLDHISKARSALRHVQMRVRNTYGRERERTALLHTGNRQKDDRQSTHDQRVGIRYESAVYHEFMYLKHMRVYPACEASICERNPGKILTMYSTGRKKKQSTFTDINDVYR